MTALTQYDRLEAPGLWRASPQDQRVNVIVALGDATLTISDSSDKVLAHWSLPAVRRVGNLREMPAHYAPSDDPHELEELELDDEDMVLAIDKLRHAIARARPRTGRLRLVLSLGLTAALGTGAVFWLPDALERHTVSVLPDATRDTVGTRLLDRVRRVAGAPCSGRQGQAALAKLTTRVLGPDHDARVVVVSQGVTWAGHLPGGLILINRAVIEDYPEPDVAAGFIIAEALRAATVDPMQAMLAEVGTWATVKLLTTGDVDSATLDSYAELALTAPPVAIALPDLVARFAAAGLRTTPYAYALDQTGEKVLGLIEADPVPLSEAAPLLPDHEWVALQGICDGQ